MRAALLIAWKDLRQRARDRSAPVMMLVPFVLAFIFSQIMGGIGSTGLRFALVDEDGGPVARVFVEEALAPIVDSGAVELTVAGSLREGRDLAESGDVSATFVIPPGFSDEVMSGREAWIDVVGNAGSPISTMAASSIAASFAGEVTTSQASMAAAASLGSLDPGRAAGMIERSSGMPDPISIVDVSATQKSLDQNTFFASGMAVFFLFFTVQAGTLGILSERREGTLSRLLAAPIPRWSILGGQLLSSFALGTFSVVVMIVSTSLLMGAEWGSPVGVGLLVTAGVMAATAMMYLIATFARTMEQAQNMQSAAALVLGMVGGALIPIAQAGGLIERVSLLTPHAWFLSGLSGLQGGGGAADILPDAAAILAFAAVAGVGIILRQGSLTRLARP